MKPSSFSFKKKNTLSKRKNASKFITKNAEENQSFGPKLNPLCKRLFLELNLEKKVEDRASEARNKKNEPTSLEFLRYLIISKKFLIASQRNPIYCLYVQGNANTKNSWNLLFKYPSVLTRNATSYAFTSFCNYATVRPRASLFFNLTFEWTKKLVFLLNPAYFCMYLNDTRYTDEQFTEAVKLFGQTNGKTGLILSAATNSSCVSLINQISSKLSLLSCPMRFLGESNLNEMELEFFRTQDSFSSIADLNLILKHNVKNIKVPFITYSTSGSMQIPKVKYSNLLEELDLGCDPSHRGSTNSLSELFKQINETFPNLNCFKLDMNSGDNAVSKTRKYTKQEIIDVVLKKHANLLEIRDICNSARVHFKLDTSTVFYSGPRPTSLWDCGWPNLIIEDRPFQIKEHRHLSGFRMAVGEDNGCTVEFLLEDQNVKITHDVCIYFEKYSDL